MGTRNSSRHSSTPTYLSDYVCSTILATKVSNSIVYHLHEPQYYQQAASHPTWQEAMKKEFNALESNHTWDIAPLSPYKKAIPCKWVYKIKYKADGSVERYKSRLVIRDDTQKEGINFNETFSHVVKFTVVRYLLTLAIKTGWTIF